MSKFYLVAVLFSAASLVGQPVITAPATTPTSPTIIVRQGGTLQFEANEPVVFSLTPGSKGSITTGGFYTAPAAVKPKHSAGGCQMFPNDSVFNSRVDSLPVLSDSATRLALLPSGYHVFIPDYDVPVNTALSTSTQRHSFDSSAFTPWMLNQNIWVWWPEQKAQGGRWMMVGDPDRHIFTVVRNPTTGECEMQEIYSTKSTNGVEQSHNFAGSAARYPMMTHSIAQLSPPANTTDWEGTVDAGGTPFYATEIKVSELNQALANGKDDLGHMLAFAMNNNYNASLFVWPGTANNYQCGTSCAVKFGMVLRLKNTYDCTGCSQRELIIVNTLKRYGMMLGDGTTTGFEMRGDFGGMPDKATKDAYVALKARNIGPSQFDIVDMDVAKVSNSKNYVAISAAPDDFVEVVATSVATSQETKVRVALWGPAIGVEEYQEHIQAGTGPQNIAYWVTGAADTTASCAFSNAVSGASVTVVGSNCVVTPPASLTTPISTDLVITATANSEAKAIVAITFLPSAFPLRFWAGYYTSAASYTDNASNVWWAKAMHADGGTNYRWVAPNMSGYKYPQGNFTGTPNQSLWNHSTFAFHDGIHRMRMPNGNYKITVGLAEVQACTGCKFKIRSQGKEYYRNISPRARAGGLVDQPHSVSFPATVTDNILRFDLCVSEMPQGYNSKWQWILIEQDPGTPQFKIDPDIIEGSHAYGSTIQFAARGWFMDDTATYAESGPGTISGSGLWSANTPTPEVGTQTVTVTSTVNPALTAYVSFPVTLGTLAISPTSATVQRGNTQQLAVTLNGSPYTRLNWSKTGGGGLSGLGKYFAPPLMDADDTVTVSATSIDDPTQTVSSTLSVIAVPPSVRHNAGPRASNNTPYCNSAGGWTNDNTVTNGAYTYLTPYTNYGYFGSGTWGLSLPNNVLNCATYANGTSTVGLQGTDPYKFTYRFPLPVGLYSVKLHWFEWRSVTQGYFMDVWIEGLQRERVLQNFDFVTCGAGCGVQTLVTRQFDNIAVGLSGNLSIEFWGMQNSKLAAINAIEIDYTGSAHSQSGGGSFAGGSSQ